VFGVPLKGNFFKLASATRLYLAATTSVYSKKRNDMNTADLIERVAVEHGRQGAHEEDFGQRVCRIVAAVENGRDVTLSGFGRCKLSSLAARQGRNPATGETIEIPASRKLVFTAAKAVRDALNNGR
jgi:DNA-binding protein HU-beta